MLSLELSDTLRKDVRGCCSVSVARLPSIGNQSMKAGRAGSNPDSTTISEPLAAMLNNIGRAVDSLNSTVVGLDAVENGYPKPPSLDISWNPTDRTLASRIARKYVLEATLVTTSEVNKAFFTALGQISKFRCLFDSEDTAAIRMTKIARHVVGNNYLAVVPALITHWRNRIVHSSTAALNRSDKRLLQESEGEIHTSYKHLSVDRLLAHFEEGRPTLKDVSCLIAMSINLARLVDRRLVQDFAKSDLDELMQHYGLPEVIQKIRATTKASKVDASVDQAFKSLAPKLLSAYRRYYPYEVAETQ